MNRLSVPVSQHDHVQGTNDASVTLVEYGDFQCPYCGAIHKIIREVQRAMGTRLRFVFRQFPLTELHAHALPAAQFSEGAASVGKFWEAHDVLFENQADLSHVALEQYAQWIDLPSGTLAAAFEGVHDARIERDFEGGVRSGVHGTPAMFINGYLYEGNHDVDGLLAAMQQR